MKTLNFEQMEQVNGGRSDNSCMLFATGGSVVSALSCIAIATGPVGWFFGGLLAAGLAISIGSTADCMGLL